MIRTRKVAPVSGTIPPPIIHEVFMHLISGSMGDGANVGKARHWEPCAASTSWPGPCSSHRHVIACKEYLELLGFVPLV